MLQKNPNERFGQPSALDTRDEKYKEELKHRVEGKKVMESIVDVLVRAKPSLIRRHGPRKGVAMWRSEAQLIPTEGRVNANMWFRVCVVLWESARKPVCGLEMSLGRSLGPQHTGAQKPWCRTEIIFCYAGEGFGRFWSKGMTSTNFFSYFCDGKNLKMHEGRENTTMNSHIPITLIEQLLTFCHICLFHFIVLKSLNYRCHIFSL